MDDIVAAQVGVVAGALSLLDGHIARMRTEKRVRLLTLLDLLVLYRQRKVFKLLTTESEPRNRSNDASCLN